MGTDARLQKTFEDLHRQLRERYDSRSLYDAFGVKPNSTEDEIRRKFRQKVLQYHPDRNKKPDAEQKIKDINDINAILSNPEKRASYDAWLRIAANQQRPPVEDLEEILQRRQAEQEELLRKAREGFAARSDRMRSAHAAEELADVFKRRGNASPGRGNNEYVYDNSFSRVTVTGGTGNVRLLLSYDGTTRIRGHTNNVPTDIGNHLLIEGLEGILVLPNNRQGLNVDISTGIGDIEGEIQHQGRVVSVFGNISLRLCAPLGVKVKSKRGGYAVTVKNMIRKPESGIYVPGIERPIGTLQVETNSGNISVDYVR